MRPDVSARRGAGRPGKFPLIDRGTALVSTAVAIALGATSMKDITLLAHQEPVFGAAPSDTTVRRTLELADPRTLDKIARARAAIRAHVWYLICATPAGFPWLSICRETAGRLAGHRPGRHADHRGAKIGSLVDEAESWPQALDLDGLTYDDLSNMPARKRLDWLNRSVDYARNPMSGLQNDPS